MGHEGFVNFVEFGVKTDRLRLADRLGNLHQMPDTKGGQAMTSIGAGVHYAVNDTFHLLGYLGRGIQNADETDRLNWYGGVLVTF